jgi:hypothetical protein
MVQVIAAHTSTSLCWPAAVPLLVHQPDLAATLGGLWYGTLLGWLRRFHQQPEYATGNQYSLKNSLQTRLVGRWSNGAAADRGEPTCSQI